MLTQALKKFPDRPYGEFVKGGNALSAESTESVLKKLSKVQ